MAKCAYCGAETKLFFNQVPVCLACSKDLEAGRKPPSSDRGSTKPKNESLEK